MSLTEPRVSTTCCTTGMICAPRTCSKCRPSSANARVVGPNYKPYLTDRWDEPYRTARIYDLLHDRHDLRPEDMLKVQTELGQCARRGTELQTLPDRPMG